jgi:DNA replication protein
MSDAMFDSIDFRTVLLDLYKQLGFDERHVMVILMLDQLLRQENTFITPEHLSLKMQLPITDIDRILVTLLDKNMMTYTTVNDRTVTSIQPLKQLLMKQFQQTFMRQTQEVSLDTSKNVFQLIEKGFARTLSPLEVSRVRDWLSFGYSEAAIATVLKEAVSSHKRSIRHMDKLLQKLTIKDNIQHEGTPGSRRDHRSIQTEMDDFTSHDERTKK